MQNKFWPACIFACLFFYSCNKKPADPGPPQQLVITSIYPATAKGGETITIKGQQLLIDGASIKVLINNKQANIIFSNNDSIKATIPQRAGSGNVAIVTNARTYIGPPFSYEYIAVVTTIAGSGNPGNDNGAGLSASFKCPWGIAIDKNGDLYIADSYNRLIRKIDTITKMVSSMSPGSLNFFSPYNITIDTISKSLYVTDFNDHLLKINSSAAMSVIFTDPQPLAGIGIGPDKKLYISNNTTGQVLRVDTTGGNRTIFSSGLVTPRNIIFDKDGKMYVAGVGIYKIADNGTFTQVMANPSQFHGWEVAIDSLGNFYEADHFNNYIRKIDKNGNITIIAGNGTAADADGIGQNSSFNGPMGIAIDKEGSLYVTTYNFNSGYGNKVRKVTFY
jgi:streptogramin lyase